MVAAELRRLRLLDPNQDEWVSRRYDNATSLHVQGSLTKQVHNLKAEADAHRIDDKHRRTLKASSLDCLSRQKMRRVFVQPPTAITPTWLLLVASSLLVHHALGHPV